MQFSMQRNKLKNLLDALINVAKSKTNTPMFGITGQVLITCNAGEIVLTATDLEIAVRLYAAEKIKKQGAICLDADVLSKVVNALPADSVIDFNINPKSNIATLTCGANTTNLKGIGAESFPKIPTINKYDIQIYSDVMQRLIQSTIFAATTDTARPILTGVKFVLTEDGLTMAAADGFRLAVITANSFSGNLDIVIPARALATVYKGIKSLSKLDEDEILIQMAYDNDAHKILFRVPGLYELIVSPIEGFFPDYAAIIPRTYSTYVTLDTAGLQNALALQKPFAPDSANAVRLSATDYRINISSTSQEKGDADAQLDAHVEGQPVSISANLNYLEDGAAVVQTDELVLRFNGSASPLVMMQKDRDDFIYVVMPMNGERPKPTEKQDKLAPQPEPEEEVSEEAVEA